MAALVESDLIVKPSAEHDVPDVGPVVGDVTGITDVADVTDPSLMDASMDPSMDQSMDASMDASMDVSLDASPLQRPGSGSGSANGSRIIKERHALTLDQRRALRRWANAQTVRPSHRACIEWFRAQFNQTISQSTVSHSLSNKYLRIDGEQGLSGSRLRFGNWPDVEKLVLIWHQQCANTGHHPTNDEMAAKAKSIFSQLRTYRDQVPPEFSPGWIHRFKKRYGLLIRRPRLAPTQSAAPNDMSFLIDAVPRFLEVTPVLDPADIQDAAQRVLGVEVSLTTCARVRDEILRRSDKSQPPADQSHLVLYNEADPEDPEVVLQNALRELQQEEEANAQHDVDVARDDEYVADDHNNHDHDHNHDQDHEHERTLPPLGAIAGEAYQQATASALGGQHQAMHGSRGSATPVSSGPRFMPTPGPAAPSLDLNLTPIMSAGPSSLTDRPVRCPFCVNQRMLRTIKEAVEHLSTHVVV